MQDFVLGKLREIEGVSVAEPAGAFYVLPQMDAFFGEGAHADGFGDVPDTDALCRCAASARFGPWHAVQVPRSCPCPNPENAMQVRRSCVPACNVA